MPDNQRPPQNVPDPDKVLKQIQEGEKPKPHQRPLQG